MKNLIRKILKEQVNTGYLDNLVNQIVKETVLENPYPFLWLLTLPFKTYGGVFGEVMINQPIYPNEPYISPIWPYAPKNAFYEMCKEIFGITEEEFNYVFEQYIEKMTPIVKDYFHTSNWRETGMVEPKA